MHSKLLIQQFSQIHQCQGSTKNTVLLNSDRSTETSETATNNYTGSGREVYFTRTAAAPSAVENVGRRLQICTVHRCAVFSYTALSLTTNAGDLRSCFLHVNDLNDAEVQEFLKSRFQNISEGTIQHVHRRVGNRILHLQEVASKTEALKKEPTDRDLIKLSDEYADTKQRAYTAGLNFFLEEFTTIPPPSLFETVIQEQVNLEEFSKALAKPCRIWSRCFYNVHHTHSILILGPLWSQ